MATQNCVHSGSSKADRIAIHLNFQNCFLRKIYIQVKNPARQWLLKHLKISTCSNTIHCTIQPLLYQAGLKNLSWVEESTHIERVNLFLDIFSIKVTRVPQTSPKSSNGQSQTAKSGPAFKFVEVSSEFI